MKQIIIARKDLEMSPGKLAAQVSHASMAFLTTMIRKTAKREFTVEYGYSHSYENKIVDGRFCSVKLDEPALYRRADLTAFAKQAFEAGQDYFYYMPVNPDEPWGELELCDPAYEYQSILTFDQDIYENWIDGMFTKIVCEAKNKNQLLKTKTIADGLGLKEGTDYFLIKDSCLTELKPEEFDESGTGRTLTCIGFRPLADDVANQISRKFQLYK